MKSTKSTPQKSGSVEVARVTQDGGEHRSPGLSVTLASENLEAVAVRG
jgi:hypothetical protein